MIPKDHDRSSIDIWFQNEARFGQQNTTTRLWAEKGSRPRAVRQQQFQYKTELNKTINDVLLCSI